MTIREIARREGCSFQRVHQILTEELAEAGKNREHERDALLNLELVRLDALYRLAHKNAFDKALPTEITLKCINSCLAIATRRAKLLGLDAPTKVAPTDPTGMLPPLAPRTDEEIADQILAILNNPFVTN